jgi:ubiquinone/menaquinone biosynthesis C-methylase UbiE
VVHISAQATTTSPFKKHAVESSTGTGFSIDSGSRIFTAFHVIKDKDNITVIHRRAEVFGLDADAEALKLTRTKLEEVGVELQLDQGLASALPYAGEWFDRVLSSLCFHHLASELKLEAMGEVLRVLRPGGEFHIAD